MNLWAPVTPAADGLVLHMIILEIYKWNGLEVTWCSGSAVAAGFPEGDIGHPCVPEFNFHEHRCASDESGRFDSADISAALTAGGGQSACSISYFGRTWYITSPLFFFFSFFRITLQSDPTDPRGLWNIWRLKDLVFRLGKKQKQKNMMKPWWPESRKTM